MSKYKEYTFDYAALIKSEQGRELFAQHCKNEFNLENFEFVVAVEDLQATVIAFADWKQNAEQARAVQDKVQAIFEQFVQNGGKKEVNLSGGIRKDLLAKLEQAKTDLTILPEVYNKAYYATTILLANDVFARFVRAPLFTQFVEKASSSTIAKLGGIHMSALPEMMLHEKHFESEILSVDDMHMMTHMGKDFYHWDCISSNPKSNCQVFVGNKSFVSKSAINKYGELKMAKLVCYLQNVSAKEIANLICSSDYFTTTFESFDNIQVLEHFSGTKSSPSYSVFRAEMGMGPLFQKREFVLTYSLVYYASQKAYLFMLRSCEHPKAYHDKKCTRGYAFTGFFIQDVDEQTCRFMQVLNINWSSVAGKIFSTNAWKQVANNIGTSIHTVCKEFLAKGRLTSADDAPMTPLNNLKDEYQMIQTMIDNNKNGFVM